MSDPDLIGTSFGEFTVLSKTTNKGSNGYPYYLCQCSCGNQREVRADNIKNKACLSCGCKRKNYVRQPLKKSLKKTKSPSTVHIIINRDQGERTEDEIHEKNEKIVETASHSKYTNRKRIEEIKEKSRLEHELDWL